MRVVDHMKIMDELKWKVARSSGTVICYQPFYCLLLESQIPVWALKVFSIRLLVCTCFYFVLFIFLVLFSSFLSSLACLHYIVEGAVRHVYCPQKWWPYSTHSNFSLRKHMWKGRKGTKGSLVQVLNLRPMWWNSHEITLKIVLMTSRYMLNMTCIQTLFFTIVLTEMRMSHGDILVGVCRGGISATWSWRLLSDRRTIIHLLERGFDFSTFC